MQSSLQGNEVLNNALIAFYRVDIKQAENIDLIRNQLDIANLLDNPNLVAFVFPAQAGHCVVALVIEVIGSLTTAFRDVSFLNCHGRCGYLVH